MQALKAPAGLSELWENDEISPRAIVQLKKHWELFEKEEAAPLLKRMAGFSQKQARELNDQLNAGTDLNTALAVIHSTGNGRDSDGNKSPGKKPSRSRAGVIPKKELITAIGDVFPRLKKNHIGALFDFAEHHGIKDQEILWAAALYVDRGGKVNEAVSQSTAAMADRSLNGLLSREIKLMKQVASYLNTRPKEDKTIREYLQVVFSSRS